MTTSSKKPHLRLAGVGGGFDAVVSDSLDIIAERAERSARRAVPYLQARPALYRELVLRIERLGSDFAE